MRILVNGRSVEAPEGAAVGDVIVGEPYTPGTMVAVIRPMDKVRKGTDEFKFTTTRGAFVLKLNESQEAKTWREAYVLTAGKSVRWATSKVIAVGSFPTKLTSVRGKAKYSRYEAFLSLADDCWRSRAYGDFWSYMLVAEGAVDIALEPDLQVYDMAALVPIVTEAGGRFTSLAGTPGPWGGNAVATNGILHDEVLARMFYCAGRQAALPPPVAARERRLRL